MACVKLMVYPDWVQRAMNDHGLTYDDGCDLKKMSGILSARDFIIYLSVNSLHMHDMLEALFLPLQGVQPGLTMEQIESYFMQHDPAQQIGYAELMNTLYDQDVNTPQDVLEMLCDSDLPRAKLVPERIDGEIIHARLVPTNEYVNDAYRSTVYGLAEIINDQSPITMEGTSLYRLSVRACLQRTA